MPILAPNFYGLWGAKQTAKGTPAVAAFTGSTGRRLIQVGGDIGWQRNDGSEAYSDLTKYGNSTDWVDSLMGEGDPVAEADPSGLAWALWMLHGTEVVTAVVGPPAASKHTFTPSLGRPNWGSFVSRIGNALAARRQHNDCMVTRVQIEGSTANKAMRFTPHIVSLDPGNIYPASPVDPVPAMPADVPFLYTDAAGTFTIDTIVYKAQSQFTFVIDEAWTPVFGDDTVPHEMVQGTPSVTIGVTLLLDDTVLQMFNKQIYGSTAPSAGAAPLRRIPALGSYSANFVQAIVTGATGRRFNLSLPANSVKWTPPAFPGPNPSGGPTEIALSGTMRGSTGYTLDVYTDAAQLAFTV